MVKVYFADIELLKEPEVFAFWFEKMNKIRQNKILKCKQEQDKKRSLLAGILLMFALEQEGLSYEALEFETNEHGKPILKSVEGIEFSLSHAGNYALCCISDEAIGADIEVLEKRIFQEEKEDDLNRMAAKILSESEYELFAGSDFEKKRRLFLKYWTRKESYSKALGMGLGMDFSKIDTESFKDSFWSDWIYEDCFVSVYTRKENCIDITFRMISNLEMQEG